MYANDDIFLCVFVCVSMIVCIYMWLLTCLLPLRSHIFWSLLLGLILISMNINAAGWQEGRKGHEEGKWWKEFGIAI